MFQEVRRKLDTPRTKQELIDMASNFPVQAKEKDTIYLLRRLFFNNDKIENIINDLLEKLINNFEVPLENLEDRLLNGIGRKEIKEIGLFFSAIRRLKDNNDFILGIRKNSLYAQFTESCKKDIADFNAKIESYIEELSTAETLSDISNIKNRQQEIQGKRQELLLKYPKEALLGVLDPEQELLAISTFTKKVELVEKEMKELDDAKQKLKEIEDLYDNLYTNSHSEENAITLAWDELKAAHSRVDILLSNVYEKQYERQKNTPKFE